MGSLYRSFSLTTSLSLVNAVFLKLFGSNPVILLSLLLSDVWTTDRKNISYDTQCGSCHSSNTSDDRCNLSTWQANTIKKRRTQPSGLSQQHQQNVHWKRKVLYGGDASNYWFSRLHCWLTNTQRRRESLCSEKVKRPSRVPGPAARHGASVVFEN